MIYVEGHIVNNVINIFILFHQKINIEEQNYFIKQLQLNLMKHQEINISQMKMVFMFIQEIIIEIILHYIKIIKILYLKGVMKITRKYLKMIIIMEISVQEQII